MKISIGIKDFVDELFAHVESQLMYFNFERIGRRFVFSSYFSFFSSVFFFSVIQILYLLADNHIFNNFDFGLFKVIKVWRKEREREREKLKRFDVKIQFMILNLNSE